MLGFTLAILAVIILVILVLVWEFVLAPGFRDGQRDARAEDDLNNWHVAFGRLAYKLGHAVESRRIDAPKRRLKRIIDRREVNDGKDAYR